MTPFLRGIALIGLVAVAMVRPVLTADAPKFQIDADRKSVV